MESYPASNKIDFFLRFSTSLLEAASAQQGRGKNEVGFGASPQIDKKVFNFLSPDRDFYSGKIESLK